MQISIGTEFRNLKVGAFTQDPFMGPLISSAHLEKVRSYVHLARAQGGSVLCGETVDELSLAEPYRKVSVTVDADAVDAGAHWHGSRVG